MLKKVREFKEALKEFRRSAGQVKRWHPEIDPDAFLGDAKTKAQVKKAKKAMDRAVEMANIDKRLEAYEKKREEYLKKQSIKEELKRQKKAYKSFNKNRTGMKWTREEYDEFWDAFGSSDLIDSYGSEQLITTGEKLLKLNKDNGNLLTKDELADMALRVSQEYEGTRATNEDMLDTLEAFVRAEIKWRQEH